MHVGDSVAHKNPRPAFQAERCGSLIAHTIFDSCVPLLSLHQWCIVAHPTHNAHCHTPHTCPLPHPHLEVVDGKRHIEAKDDLVWGHEPEAGGSHVQLVTHTQTLVCSYPQAPHRLSRRAKCMHKLKFTSFYSNSQNISTSTRVGDIGPAFYRSQLIEFTLPSC